MKRLFCKGEGASFKWVMADNKAEALKLLGEGTHQPDPDDLRHLWMSERLYDKTPQEIQTMFGITRQALSLWRQKAGADLPLRSEHMAAQKREAIKALLSPDKTPMDIAKEVHCTTELVKEIAAEAGVKLANRQQKKPEDDEIIRLSQGRTWRQLAEVCGVSLPTLRHYVYARPAMAESIRARIVYEQFGAPSHGRVDVDKLVEMYESGQTAYAISKHFGTESVTIIYWLKKLGIYKQTA